MTENHRYSDATMDDMAGYILMQESDRGAFIVAAAMLEDLLKALMIRVVSRMQCHPKAKKDLIRAAQSFHGAITFSHMLGVIDRAMYDDLMLIKAIRNKVAHTFSHFVVDGEIESMMMKLSRAGQAKAFCIQEGFTEEYLAEEAENAVGTGEKVPTHIMCVFSHIIMLLAVDLSFDVDDMMDSIKEFFTQIFSPSSAAHEE